MWCNGGLLVVILPLNRNQQVEELPPLLTKWLLQGQGFRCAGRWQPGAPPAPARRQRQPPVDQRKQGDAGGGCLLPRFCEERFNLSECWVDAVCDAKRPLLPLGCIFLRCIVSINRHL
jgi:hypothetical protein